MLRSAKFYLFDEQTRLVEWLGDRWCHVRFHSMVADIADVPFATVSFHLVVPFEMTSPASFPTNGADSHPEFSFNHYHVKEIFPAFSNLHTK